LLINYLNIKEPVYNFMLSLYRITKISKESSI
jgi:hypothetical protein